MDWLSDIYGRNLVSKIFTKIEALDFDGKKKIKIKVLNQLTRNEYTNDEFKELDKIFGIYIPFDLVSITNMFVLLNYKAKLENDNTEKEYSSKYLVLEWD